MGMAKELQAQIEIPLPFCLCVKDGIYPVMHEGKIYQCRLRKVWSELAKGSRNLDIEQPGESQFFFKVGTGEITTCKDIELRFDKRGSLRYSIFEAILKFPVETSIEETIEKITNDVIISEAMCLVNKLLEVYRFVTDAFYITRIGPYDLNQVRDGKIMPCMKIAKPESETQQSLIMGFINLSDKVAFGTAQLNLSQEKHETIKELLMKDFTIPIEKTLILNAKDHTHSDKYDVAVFELGTALEVAINNFLSKEKTEEEIRKFSFEDKYNYALEEMTGHSLKEDNILWQALKKVWDIRCNIAHRGQCVWIKRGTVIEVIDTEDKVTPLIEKTERIIDYIKNCKLQGA